MRSPLLGCLIGVCILVSVSSAQARDPRLQGAFRKPSENGWTIVHLEGSPSNVGYQHGYLLFDEIEKTKKAIALSVTHEVMHSWPELRASAEEIFWPKVPQEYRDELQGIADGLKARGSQIDVLDLTAMNGYMEFDYYFTELNRRRSIPANHTVAEHCSAFIATGSYTKDGKIVFGHNNWTDYLTGSHWDMVFDITPSSGQRFIMDGMPGLIHSADDFGINNAGIMITETTISSFHGFDEHAVPEFVRARKAMQYSESIDDFAHIMEDGNNGGYANTWLVGDRKTSEIARLELGLKNVTLERSKDGYFVGSNFPINPKLTAEETTFPTDPDTPNLCRKRRWEQLMSENKGKIDVASGQKFETDHYDVITHEYDPNERTICGHIDRSSRGLPGWQGPYGPAGTAEAKVADSTMAEHLSFVAGMGHPCGVKFDAKAFLKLHPEYSWQEPLLEDMKANAWTVVSVAEPAASTNKP
jgi:hypothetical protein